MSGNWISSSCLFPPLSVSLSCEAETSTFQHSRPTNIFFFALSSVSIECVSLFLDVNRFKFYFADVLFCQVYIERTIWLIIFCCRVVFMCSCAVLEKCRQSLRLNLNSMHWCVCVSVCEYVSVCMYVSFWGSLSQCLCNVCPLRWCPTPPPPHPIVRFKLPLHRVVQTVVTLSPISPVGSVKQSVFLPPVSLKVSVSCFPQTQQMDSESWGSLFSLHYRWCAAPSFICEWNRVAPTPPLSHDPLPMLPPEATGGGGWV